MKEKINKTGWIYESPDNGKTVTRRKLGADLSTREVLTNQEKLELFDNEKSISTRR
tara:strand:- start:1041 stop:1208 length:168 start_codon:yes stop_codon:yes gene_type:complete